MGKSTPSGPKECAEIMILDLDLEVESSKSIPNALPQSNFYETI